VGKEKGVRGRDRENGQWEGNRKSKENRINGEGEKRRGAVVCQSGWSGKTETYHKCCQDHEFFTRDLTTKFPVDLQGTFQQNSTSFYTVTE